MNADNDRTMSPQARSVRLHVRKMLLYLVAYEKRKGSEVSDAPTGPDGHTHQADADAPKKL